MIWKQLSNIVNRVRGFFSRKYSLKLVEEEPDTISDKIIYVVGDEEFQAFAVMLCPCGCHSKIHLNLLSGNKPTWSVSTKSGIPTLKPSIWRKVGCESHFFIRSGKVVWAGTHTS
jgi:hypothetical protein